MDGQLSVSANEMKRPSSEPRRGDLALLAGFSLLLFFVHMLVSGRYAYFVDEV